MKCIIVDDERPSIEELKYFIENFSNIEILKSFQDSTKALRYLEDNSVDLIFLDISMPGVSGMTIGKIVSKFENSPLIVFITAHKEYAVDAFEIEAYDYILKPYSEHKIIGLLRKLDGISSEAGISDKITLWDNDKMVVIYIGDIDYCKARERETLIFVAGNMYIFNGNITTFMGKLPENMFFRSHRSFILNLDKIKEIIPWFNNTYNVRIEGYNDDIPVSRSNISEFRKRMGI
ncbi:MAG: LytTR family DNA-binding domain-containing protein [Firmicutes bacterium]|nr:LytTR family DNA-binding domain-containing protein [Bacillota bacterium]